MDSKNEVVVFGGGCFWCTEAVFKMLRGVISILPGYTGGKTKNPTYDEVCSGGTGHAEVTRVEFNPAEISFNELLTVFFATHDSTTLNRQGNDVGTQYRSAIFYTGEEQREQAAAFIGALEASHKEGGHVTTEVKPLTTFYPAEDYHRDYYAKNPDKAYCELIINPKLEKVQQQFADLLAKNQEKSS